MLVVLEGSGHLEWEDGSLPLQRGAVVLVPHQVGATRITVMATMVSVNLCPSFNLLPP